VNHRFQGRFVQLRQNGAPPQAFDSRARAPGWPANILTEITRIAPRMAMDINAHDSFPHASASSSLTLPSSSNHQTRFRRWTQGQISMKAITNALRIIFLIVHTCMEHVKGESSQDLIFISFFPLTRSSGMAYGVANDHEMFIL
jgi:hypothetical protein